MIIGLYSNTFGAKGWLKAWSIYLMAFPFYVFPAGSVQPSDLFIAIVIFLFIATNGLKWYADNKKVLKNFLRFCIYLTIINFGVFVALLGKTGSLPWYVFCAFYFYNLSVMGLALALYRKYGSKFLYTTLYSCFLATILQIVLSSVLSTGGEGVRGALFFTNPNQLGYYSLCGLSIILVLESVVKIPKLFVYLSFFLFSYLALVSVSKAALGAMAILFAAYLIANKIFSLSNILALVVVGGVGLFVLTTTEFGDRFLNNLEQRQINEADRPAEITEWEYRGYDRISHHPYYLIFGAGEGGYNRFDTFIEGHEMHSSIGTIIFCYGIPGTTLFVIFVVSLLRGLPWYYLVYSLPLFAYGVTHMGLRFTIFWVALMMFPIIRVEILKKKLIKRKQKIEAIKDYHGTSFSQVPAQRTV